MTPDRRAALADLANGALANLRAGCDPSPEGLGALDAILLHWASAATILDAVEAGYRVRWEDFTDGNGYTVRDCNNTVVAFGYGAQADAWRAAVAHMRGQS